jgi:hypothetical protein
MFGTCFFDEKMPLTLVTDIMKPKLSTSLKKNRRKPCHESVTYISYHHNWRYKIHFSSVYLRLRSDHHPNFWVSLQCRETELSCRWMQKYRRTVPHPSSRSTLKEAANHWYQPRRLNGIKTRKNSTWIHIAMKTSNLISTKQKPSSEVNSRSASQKGFPSYAEQQDSLSCSHESVTEPNPERDEPNLRHHNLFL